MAGQPAPAFAGLLRQLRAEAGLTQEELAEASGLSPRTISDLERGVHRLAHQDTARLLSDALGLDGPVRGLFVAAARGRASAAEVLAARGGLPRSVSTVAGHQADVERLLGAVVDSPYQGLKAFGERDALFFFGREAATAAVLERLSRLLAGTGLLVVSGVSGAGKSSLLRAGVLPQLRKSGLMGAPEAASWPCLVFTPTHAPADELALRMGLLAGADAAGVRRGLDADPARLALTARQAALMRPSGSPTEPERPAAESVQRRLLVVVDQFEQVFTLCADEGQRLGFITALHAAATTVQGPDRAPAALVVLAVRADHEARCADYPLLAGPAHDRYLVTAMTDRQLRMAITEPAKKAGSELDADLVEVLLTEARTGQRAGSAARVLPYLSQALDQAWRSRGSNTVTLADYERVGGVEGAVAGSAQRTYERLSPAQQGAARQVFMRLAVTSDDAVSMGGRLTWAELAEGKNAVQARDAAEVVEAFAAERLLTLAADGVEISHEVLLNAWPLLRDTWLADIHADRVARARLHHAAAEWAGHSRDVSYLYSGSLLAEADNTAARLSAEPARYPPLSQTESDFLDASNRVHRHRAHRRHALAALLVALAIGFSAVGVLAVRLVYQAAHQNAIGISERLIGESLLLYPSQPTLAKLLSIEAWRLDHSEGSRIAMLDAAGIRETTVFADRTGPVAFAPHGKLLASDNTNGNVWLRDLGNSQRSESPFAGPAGVVIAVAFSPNGDILAGGSSAGETQLWNAATHHLITTLSGHDGPVVSVAFSPDGTTLATGYNDGTVRLWNAVNHHLIITLNGQHGEALSVAFSPDGTELAIGYNDGTVQLWNAASYKLITTLNGHHGAVLSVAFSPKGDLLAAGGSAGVTQLWNAAHRPVTTVTTLNGHRGAVQSVAFSPDGTKLATGNYDGTVRLWSATTYKPIGILTGPASAVWSLAFSPDGRTLATGSYDKTVRLWDVAGNGPIEHSLTGDTGPVLMRDLCASAGRSLTHGEWSHYLPGQAYQRICP